MKRGFKNAFTLTETLVIVPVAALLTTMLFAVSSDMKQQLQAAACLNNMRQWGLGLMLYANDYRDYFPYDGQPYVSPCGGANTNAWFNVVPRYIGQNPLCDIYTAANAGTGTYPTPLTRSIWSCPSATNTSVQPALTNLYFMYALNSCLHPLYSTHVGFRRSRMTSPTSTILFCEGTEDPFPETNGKYDTVTRHFGGSNFVFGDGHADWIALTNFCRALNPNGCPSPLGDISWDSSVGGDQLGDWNNTIVHYHWWPYRDASLEGIN